MLVYALEGVQKFLQDDDEHPEAQTRVTVVLRPIAQIFTGRYHKGI